MITILHGENVFASRKELDEIKETFDGEIVSLDGKNLSETDFVQATQSRSLLDVKRMIVIENFLSGEKRMLVDLSEINSDIIFWEDKELSKTVLDEFKNLQVRVLFFKTQTSIFKFCDQLLPKNGATLIPLFRECLKSAEPEYIFVMIVRQFRLMLNPVMVLPWQQAKTSNQAKAFRPDRLAKIYKELLEMDYRQKTGQAPQDLSFNLELFLLNL